MAHNILNQQDVTCYYFPKTFRTQPQIHQAPSTVVVRSRFDKRFEWLVSCKIFYTLIKLHDRTHIRKLDIGVTQRISGQNWAEQIPLFPNIEEIRFEWRRFQNDREDTRTRRKAAQRFFEPILQASFGPSLKRLCLHGFAIRYKDMEQVFALCAKRSLILEIEQVTLVQVIRRKNVGADRDLSQVIGCNATERGWVRLVREMRGKYPGMAQRKALKLVDLREFYASGAGRQGLFFHLGRSNKGEEVPTAHILQMHFERGVWGREWIHRLHTSWCAEGIEDEYTDQWGFVLNDLHDEVDDDSLKDRISQM